MRSASRQLRRHARWIAILFLALFLVWFTTSEESRVWLVRNTLEYHLLTQWWAVAGAPQQGATGTLRGAVTDHEGTALPGAEVLVARWDGTTYHTRSDAEGQYAIEGIPAGRYRPVAAAPGYDARVAGRWPGVPIEAGDATHLPIELAPQTPREVVPGEHLRLGEPTTLRCERGETYRAVRRAVTPQSGGQPSQQIFFYTPTEGTELPTLLIVYPGPVDTWECASVPMAAAGYGVVAVGPEYSLDLERDVDELEQLLAFVREGAFPHLDATKIGVMGGSYSALLVLRLLQRDPTVEAAVLLGPPTDLFDSRRRWQSGTFVPPFEELERALIGLGFPDRDPFLYWRYSAAYHVRPDFPPIAIFHSYQDEIVPYQQSEQLAAALEARDVPHELHLFDGATHYLLEDGEQAREIYDLTLVFLARELKR